MRTTVSAWEMGELLRAAERSRKKSDGGARFARAAERVLDPELVRAVEHATGVAIAEHMHAVFASWDGRRETLAIALCDHVHALGLPLVVDAPEEEDDDDLDEGDDYGAGEHPHVERLRARGTWTLGAAIALLGVALLTMLLSIALALASVEGRFSGLVCFAVTTLPSGLVGLALAVAGARRRARARRLRDLDGLGLSHTRLPLERVERELEVGASEARALIREALGHGILEGRLDLEEGVFVSAIADDRVGHRTIRCTTCGAASAVLRGPGLAQACPYCGAPARR